MDCVRPQLPRHQHLGLESPRWETVSTVWEVTELPSDAGAETGVAAASNVRSGGMIRLEHGPVGDRLRSVTAARGRIFVAGEQLRQDRITLDAVFGLDELADLGVGNERMTV